MLALTAVLYTAGLSRSGWANDFYAAAVQAGTKSWKAFFFGSFDSSNFITVDKPAGFLWPMELSARIFGVNYWSLLVPQALAGVATVGVLYATVRRWFGPAAAVIAGAVMALAPVATLIFRFNDPDAFITLTAVLAAYAVTRALESGSTRWLALAGLVFGLGFLGKMLAGFLALPAMALAYLVCGPHGVGKRIWQLLVGGGAMLATAGWWVTIVLLTPAASRPFIGSTTDNNILQLTFGYNGLSRLTGNRGGFGGTGRAAGGAGGFGGGGFGGATGITRMFTHEWGGQISWLIPAALIAFVAMLWLSRRGARTDRLRAAALMWGGWLLVAGLVLSFMSGTTHSYYAIALAPPIGALTGIGAVSLWRARHTWFARAVMAGALVITAAWAWVLLGRSPGWFPWQRVVIVIAAAAAAGAILAEPFLRPGAARGRLGRAGPVLWPGTARRRLVLAAVPVSLAVIAGLGGPLAYSLDTAATSSAGTSPSAGPPLTAAVGSAGAARGFGRDPFPGAEAAGAGAAGGGAAGGGAASGEFPGFAGGLAGGRPGRIPGGFGGAGGFGRGGSATVSSVFAKLLENGAARYKWAAATDGANSAAAMELATGGVPVMAIGGFRGTDPAPSLAEFEKLVSSHQIHYYVAGGGFGGRAAGGAGGGFGGGGPGGGTTDASQISRWVAAHFTGKTVGGMTVYDLTTPARS